MGHDFDILMDSEDDYGKDSEYAYDYSSQDMQIGHAYLTFNWSEYASVYGGARDIHGHSNTTVMDIFRPFCKRCVTMVSFRTRRIIWNPGHAVSKDGVVTTKSGPTVWYGCWNEDQNEEDLDGDAATEIKNKQCYAYCIRKLLKRAEKFYAIYGAEDSSTKIYWYSDQVWEITPFVGADGTTQNGNDSLLKKYDALKNKEYAAERAYQEKCHREEQLSEARWFHATLKWQDLQAYAKHMSVRNTVRFEMARKFHVGLLRDATFTNHKEKMRGTFVSFVSL